MLRDDVGDRVDLVPHHADRTRRPRTPPRRRSRSLPIRPRRAGHAPSRRPGRDREGHRAEGLDGEARRDAPRRRHPAGCAERQPGGEPTAERVAGAGRVRASTSRASTVRTPSRSTTSAPSDPIFTTTAGTPAASRSRTARSRSSCPIRSASSSRLGRNAWTAAASVSTRSSSCPVTQSSWVSSVSTRPGAGRADRRDRSLGGRQRHGRDVHDRRRVRPPATRPGRSPGWTATSADRLRRRPVDPRARPSAS